MQNSFVIEPSNRLYQKALKREIGIWRNAKYDSNQAFLFKEFTPTEIELNNTIIPINTNKDWLDCIGKIGQFEKALVLGGNDANLEKYLLNNKVVGHFTNYDIVHDEDSNSGTTKKFADLNFIELAENQFDLVIAKSILHHIINLEHLLNQVNKALKPNGKLIVFEYIGENKQQWKKEKVDIINNKIQLWKWINEYNFAALPHNYFNEWPFESIRSEEIPEILNFYFKDGCITEKQWSIFDWPVKYHLGQYEYKQKIKISPETRSKILNEVQNAELYFKQNKKIHRCLLFGIYSKTSIYHTQKVRKWNRDKQRKELLLNGPLKVRIKSLRNTYSHIPVLQIIFRVLYKLIK